MSEICYFIGEFPDEFDDAFIYTTIEEAKDAQLEAQSEDAEREFKIFKLTIEEIEN